MSWRKSSYSGDGGQCIEVSDDLPNVTPVRDSKDSGGPVLLFSSAAWDSFLTAVRAEEFGAL
ncbi:DUF397 domain-containing protein [Kitasatospora sp. NPDC004240]